MKWVKPCPLDDIDVNVSEIFKSSSIRVYWKCLRTENKISGVKNRQLSVLLTLKLVFINHPRPSVRSVGYLKQDIRRPFV